MNNEKQPSSVLHIDKDGKCVKQGISVNPSEVDYPYGIGLLLVFLLVNQVLTGIQVGSYYIVSIDVALSSVDYLMREITYGWSFRYLHSQRTSFSSSYGTPQRFLLVLLSRYHNVRIVVPQR